jgi:hypothetical protein
MPHVDLAQLLRNANGRRFKEERILDLFGQVSFVMKKEI